MLYFLHGNAREKHASPVAMQKPDGFAAIQRAEIAVTGRGIALGECIVRREAVAAIAADTKLDIAAALLFGARYS